MQSQRDDLSKRLSDLEKSHADSLTEQLMAQETHTKALETQQAEIEQKYASLLEIMQSDADRLEQEKSAALSGKQSALNELATLKKELHAEIDELKKGQSTRNQGSPTGADEIAQRYEMLLAEKAAADKEHQEAVAKLKESLTQDHERAFSKLQSEYNALQERAAKTDQEQSDAIELLKEEFKTGHSNDMAALRQQLGDVQKRHSDLTEQKASMDQAHEEAISELMAGMEASTNDALQQLREKYDALTAELEAERLNHISELETARREAAEQQSLHQAASQQSQSPEVADTSASDVAVYEEKLRVLEQDLNKAIRAAEDAEDRIETMKGEVVRKHLARVEPLEKENAFLLDKIDRLEAMLAAGDRIARVAATVGERRNINSLAEEDEDSAEDAWPGAQPFKVNGTGDHKDVVGTVS